MCENPDTSSTADEALAAAAGNQEVRARVLDLVQSMTSTPEGYAFLMTPDQVQWQKDNVTVELWDEVFDEVMGPDGDSSGPVGIEYSADESPFPGVPTIQRLQGGAFGLPIPVDLLLEANPEIIGFRRWERGDELVQRSTNVAA